jgi:hypothetical protein
VCVCVYVCVCVCARACVREFNAFNICLKVLLHCCREREIFVFSIAGYCSNVRTMFSVPDCTNWEMYKFLTLTLLIYLAIDKYITFNICNVYLQNINCYKNFFLWVKRPGRDSHHSSLSGTEVENERSSTSSPPTCFITLTETSLHFKFYK